MRKPFILLLIFEEKIRKIGSCSFLISDRSSPKPVAEDVSEN
jgi:hypothetical protein